MSDQVLEQNPPIIDATPRPDTPPESAIEVRESVSPLDPWAVAPTPPLAMIGTSTASPIAWSNGRS